MSRPRVALSLVAIFGLGVLLGFVRDVLIARSFGASAESDAYFTGYLVPSIVFTMLLNQSILAAVAVPTLTNMRAKGDTEAADRMAGTLLTVVVGTFVVLAVLMSLLAPRITPLLGDSTPSTVACLRIMAFIMPFLGLWAAIGAIQQAERVFIPAALASVVANLIVCLVLIGSPGVSIVGLAMATVVGTAAQALWVVARMRRSKQRPRLGLHPEFRLLMARVLPLMATVTLLQAVHLGERVFSGPLGAGVFTAVTLARKVALLPLAGIADIIGAVILPDLSLDSATATERPSGKFFRDVLLMTWFLVLPLVILLAGLSAPIAKILFQRGEFGPDDVEVVANLLPFLGLSILVLGLVTVTNRLFYAHGDNVRVLVIAVGATALYWVATPVLVSGFGYVGLGLGYLAHTVGLLALQFGALKRRRYNPLVGGTGIGRGFIKIGVAGLAMTAAVLACRVLLFEGLATASSIRLLADLTIAGILAAAAYLGVARLLRVEELPRALRTAKGLLTRRRR